MKNLRLWLAAAAVLIVTAGAAIAGFQSGVLTLTGFPALGRIPIDNGGPEFTNIREAAGTVTANGATPVTVANANVTTGSIIIFTLKTIGGTVGAYPTVPTITAGTGFTFVATASDTSVYSYVILG